MEEKASTRQITRSLLAQLEETETKEETSDVWRINAQGNWILVPASQAHLTGTKPPLPLGLYYNFAGVDPSTVTSMDLLDLPSELKIEVVRNLTYTDYERLRRTASDFQVFDYRSPMQQQQAKEAKEKEQYLKQFSPTATLTEQDFPTLPASSKQSALTKCVPKELIKPSLYQLFNQLVAYTLFPHSDFLAPKYAYTTPQLPKTYFAVFNEMRYYVATGFVELTVHIVSTDPKFHVSPRDDRWFTQTTLKGITMYLREVTFQERDQILYSMRHGQASLTSWQNGQNAKRLIQGTPLNEL